MKIRYDFVTNSSSSSFIINKNEVSIEKLKQILLEIANKEQNYMFDDPYTYTDYSEIEDRYRIQETPSDSYIECQWNTDLKEYSNHYFIDNDGNCRYDWYVIDEVLGKYGISYAYGFCD